MHENEEQLLRELDRHDDLVIRCALGTLDFREFEKAYDTFYPRYALDGHESGEEGQRLLMIHADRIVVHRDIWEHVLTKVTADEFLHREATVAAGFIGSEEAVRRLRTLAERHLKAR